MLNLAKKVAKLSEHKFRIGAVIAHGSRIVSFGVNKNKTHPNQINPYTEEVGGSLHAELDAVLNAEASLKGASIYVARLLKDGTEGLAKPCSECQRILDSKEIKHIYWTVGEIDA